MFDGARHALDEFELFGSYFRFNFSEELLQLRLADFTDLERLSFRFSDDVGRFPRRTSASFIRFPFSFSTFSQLVSIPILRR